MIRRLRLFVDPRGLLVLGVALVLIAYWPGLAGGFLLDDTENFTQLERYARGDIGWLGPVVTNGSGPLGRPISMASFVATVAAGGYTPWAFKVGNLFLHASIGMLMGLLVLLVLRRDPLLSARAQPIAVLLAIIWMALPIQVSTVLYPVQRMAQLSALFIALGLVVYLALRTALVSEPGSRRLAIGLGASVVVFTVLGALSKENGLLLPLLCLALELSVFADERAGRRPATMVLLLTLAMPALVGALLALVYHERLFGLYDTRAFTLGERLLTEPRVLWEYVWNILLPAGTRLGVYQDDFPLSHSFMSPISTLPAMLAWAATLIAALRWRKAAPTLAAGILLFLAGHAMESSIFPLEIYFEHRNYFPAIGVLLAVTGGVAWAASRASAGTPEFRRIVALAPLALVLVMLSSVYGRALVWGSPATLLAQSEASRPDSTRVQSMLAARAIESRDLLTAKYHLDAAERLSGPSERGAIALWRLIASCAVGTPIDEQSIRDAEARLQPQPTTFAIRAAIILAEHIEAGRCQGFDASRAVPFYQHWVELLAAKPTTHAAWRLRYLTARLMAINRDWDRSLALGERAWQDSDWNSGVGVFLVQVANSMGDPRKSAYLLGRLIEHAPAWDFKLQEAIGRFQRHLRNAADVERAPPLREADQD